MLSALVASGLARRDDGHPGAVRCYGYDALDRLTEVRDGASNALLESHTYDPFGNRSAKAAAGATTAYVFDT